MTAGFSGSSWQATSATLIQTVNASAVPPTIQTTSLAGGTVGTPYSQTVTATGGATPYTWALQSGSLPTGVSLNTGTGVISGTPSVAAGFSFTLSVTGANNAVSSMPYSVTISTQNCGSGDFTLSASPTSQTVTAGNPATYTISVNPSGGFCAAVTFSAPGYAGALLSPGQSAAQTTLTLPTSATTAGTTSVTIFGQYGQVRSVDVALIINQAPDFSIGVSPSTQTAASPSGAASYAVSVNPRGGFAGTVSFAATGLPTGISAMFQPPTTASGITTLTLVAGPGSPTGTIPFTIQSSSGSLNHIAAASFIIGASPTTAPAAIITPYSGGTLNGATTTFQWTTGTGVSQYRLLVGRTQGASDVFSTTGTGQTAAVPLPAGDQTLFATLGSMISGSWQYAPPLAYNVNRTSAPPATKMLRRSDQATNSVNIYNDNQVRQFAWELQDINGQPAGDAHYLQNCILQPAEAGLTAFFADSDIQLNPAYFTMSFNALQTSGTGTFYTYCQYPDDQGNLYTVPSDTPVIVADASPVITGVQQLSPLYPNGSTIVILYGYNFGQSTGNVVLCPHGTSPCTQSPDLSVTVAPSGWNNDVFGSSVSYSQINLNVTAGPNVLNDPNNPLGAFDAQITDTSGVFGNGFVPGPAPQSPTAQNTACVPPRDCVRASPLPTLQVTSDGVLISAGSTVYIRPTSPIGVPVMPVIRATVAGLATGDTVANLQLSASFQQTLPNGTTSTITRRLDTQPADPTATQIISSGVPPFGNSATVTWALNGANHPPFNQPPFNFTILGQNPDQPTVIAAASNIMINGVAAWFAPNIAIHETNASQFCDASSRTAGAPYCINGTHPGLPIFGTPGGYGIMQLDPPNSADDIWNWQTNIASAQTRFQNLAGLEADGEGGQAYQFWIRQVRQWKAAGGNSAAPFPSDVSQNPATYAGCKFLPPDPQQATVRNTGQPNTYWYGDAILMKQNAGTIDANGVNANYVSWIASPPNWSFHPANIVNSDIVYEFCSCKQSAGCIRGH